MLANLPGTLTIPPTSHAQAPPSPFAAATAMSLANSLGGRILTSQSSDVATTDTAPQAFLSIPLSIGNEGSEALEPFLGRLSMPADSVKVTAPELLPLRVPSAAAAAETINPRQSLSSGRSPSDEMTEPESEGAPASPCARRSLDSSLLEIQKRERSMRSLRSLLHVRNEVSILKDLKIGKLLGRGSYGRVHKARWKSATVAVKIIEHHSHGSKTTSGGRRFSVARESLLSCSMSHPNVVQTYHVSTMTVGERAALTRSLCFGDSEGQAEQRSEQGSVMEQVDEQVCLGRLGLKLRSI